MTIGRLSEEDDLETKARLVLDEYNRQSSEACFESSSANWNYAVNINDDNEKIKLRESLEYSNFQKESWKNISSQFKTRGNFKDPVLKRMFQKISITGMSAAALPEEKLKEVSSLFKKKWDFMNLTTIYSSI